jgi:hypothetical protein
VPGTAICGKWFVDNRMWLQRLRRPAVGVVRDGPARRSPMAKKSSSGSSYRSAVTGCYVTAKHGKASPNTTVKEKR